MASPGKLAAREASNKHTLVALIYVSLVMVKISLVTASTAASTLKRWCPEGEAIKRRSKNQTLDRKALRTKQYIVPLFQRTYNWKLDNWETIWDGLLAIYESETRQKHFLGALVSEVVKTL